MPPDTKRRPTSTSARKRTVVNSANASGASPMAPSYHDQYIVPQKYAYSSLISRKRQKDSLGTKFINRSNSSTPDNASSEASRSTTSSDEYKLLCKLYIPRSHRVKEGRLMEKLPMIICRPRSYGGGGSKAADATAKLGAAAAAAGQRAYSNYIHLNYQLHLLLATITTKYIDSWYSSKLNTDNFEFIETVYSHLCHVILSISKRVTKAFRTVDQSLAILNEFVDILTSFIADVSNREYEASSGEGRNVVHENLSSEQQISAYLETRHVIFSNSTDSASIHEEEDSLEHKPSKEVVYFRVLSRKVLEIVFGASAGGSEAEGTGGAGADSFPKGAGSSSKPPGKDEEYDSNSDGDNEYEESGIDLNAESDDYYDDDYDVDEFPVQPLSPIAEGLVVSILGDLVFVKLLDAFSNPNFLLGVIELIFEKLDVKAEGEEDKRVEGVQKGNGAKKTSDNKKKATAGRAEELSNTSRDYKLINYFKEDHLAKVQQFTLVGYNFIAKVVSGVRFYLDQVKSQNSKEETRASGQKIVDSSIFPFLDLLTGFSDKKPILYGLLKHLQSLLLTNSVASQIVDNKLKSYILEKVAGLSVASDEGTAGLVENLRRNLFPSKDEPPKPKKPDLDIEVLAAKIAAVLEKRIPTSEWVPTLSAEKETHKEGKYFIPVEAFLRNFENPQLNKLLIVEWLDMILGNVFPELVSK